MTTPTNNARARQVEMILQQVDTLPTLSPVATRLLSIGSDNDADLDEVVMLSSRTRR
jgi:HD-like signal output (HDOD) protein